MKTRKRSDLIWLPLVCLLTVGVLGAAVELTARRLFPTPKTDALHCLILNDASTGVHAIPNSTCHDQLLESPLVEYRYNNCGHRAGMPCQPKQPGTLRIVLVGSSFAEGLYVPREQTFAALLPKELSRDTGRSVELYNEGMQWGTPHSVNLRFNEVLAAKPDIILWALTPFDIENASLVIPYVAVHPHLVSTGNSAAPAPSFLHETKSALKTKGLEPVIRGAWRRVMEAFGATRTSFLLQHYLSRSPTHYVKTFLMVKSDTTEFLAANPNEGWQSDLRRFDGYDAELEAKARAAGIPLVVTLLPDRAQAAMISTGSWPEGYDPYKLGSDLRSIVEKNGGTYLDILPSFRALANPEQNYYPVDGHIDHNGHAMMSHLLARSLTGGAVPALAVTRQARNGSGQARNGAGQGQ